jgi:uncharacterized protein YjcR
MVEPLPTYSDLLETLKQHGYGGREIADRLGIGSNSLHALRTRHKADPTDERYRRLTRLARQAKAYHGAA